MDNTFLISEIDQIRSYIDRSIIDATFKEPIAVSGGHFLFEIGQKNKILNKPDILSTSTFKIACSLVNKFRNSKLQAKLSYLIGDLSVANDRQSFLSNMQLPSEYKKILKEHYLTQDDMIFFSEHNLRNRFARKLKHYQLTRAISVHDDNYLITDTDIPIAKVHKIANGQFCTPFCRGILAQQMMDIHKKGYKTIINLFDSRMYKCHGSFGILYYKIVKDDCLDAIINFYFYPYNKKISVKNKVMIISQVLNPVNALLMGNKYDHDEFLKEIKSW